MSAVHVLVAPDSFKGTMSAGDVAAAVSEGVLAAGGTAELCPLADGGEGTLAALATALRGTRSRVPTTGPDGRPVMAEYLLGADGTTAVVETASASGLHLVNPETVDAFAASSRGVGQLIATALDAGARDILIGVGGSGCTDGGAGAIEAIEERGGIRGGRLTVLCDVTTPFEDAAVVFGPQKGADPATVVRLTERLHTQAAALPRDPRGVPRTGAAGGLAGGLWARFDARLESGIDHVLVVLGFADLLARADVVVTGEGRLDSQTAHGKVIAGVGAWAERAGIPVVAVVGRNETSAVEAASLGLSRVLEAGTPELLRRAGVDVVDAFDATLPTPVTPASGTAHTTMER